MNSGVEGTQWVACEWEGGGGGGWREDRGRVEGGWREERREGERTEEGGTKAER